MLIVGAKGFAKEVLEVCHQNNELENLVFYDDINFDIGEKLYDEFPILKSIEQAKDYISNIDNRFTLGIGNPLLRKKLHDKFIQIGGVFSSTISKNTKIGSYDNRIENGCNILAASVISNSVTIGKGCIVYFNTVITHDCTIGDFVQISPSVNILGRVKVGNFTQIGSSSIILPDITIGQNVIIGAGSVVTKDIPDNSLAVGVPAKVVKQLEPLKI
jgi:sugar O-acyltransferase (sialic acid O-acetyltransferase NeuD family)